MQKNKLILLSVTAFFLLVVGLTLLFQSGSATDAPIFAVVTASGETEEISCWKGEDGYYLFLPGYAELSQVHLRTTTESRVVIDEIPLEHGISCDRFALDVPHKLVFNRWGRTFEEKLFFMQSHGIATMLIDTRSGDNSELHAKKGLEEPGTIRLFTTDGSLAYASDLESINTRGNTTWEASDKKPYSIKLREDADLLGMGQAQKWILQANALDASHLRNKLAFEYADAVGLAFSPASEWVDLYLNGEYAGLYLLSERNEVNPQRVDIAADGSFLVSFEPEQRLIAQKYKYVSTQAGLAARIHYPAAITDEALLTISNSLQSVENAILADDGIDPMTGSSWTELIDLDSWVKKYLIEEMFGNLDGFSTSQFFYSDGNEADPKIYAGPVWDYDLSMGNDSYEDWSITNPDVFVVGRHWNTDETLTCWIKAMYQKTVFQERMCELFEQVFLPELENFLNVQMQDYVEEIELSAALDQTRWGGRSLKEETNLIKEYLTQHADFLRRTWLEGAQYCQVSFTKLENDVFYTVLPGERLHEIPQVENTDTTVFCGFYYANTNEPFDITQPITEDIEIYAKWEDTSSKKLGRIIKLIPLGVIGVLGLVILLIDIKRMRKSR